MEKLVTKFTNISDRDFDVRYNGKKVGPTIPAGETIDLPMLEAKVAAKDLANRVLGSRGQFGNWKEDMENTQKEILNDVPVSETPPAPEAPEDESPKNATDETPEAPADNKADYSKMTAKELMVELDNAGIEYSSKATKVVLIELLENPPADDKADGEADEEEFPEDKEDK